jgi:adenosylhomocysteinase
MQMSFANQLIAAIRIHSEHGSMERRVYGVDDETEREVARAALTSMGVSIGKPTREQKAYAKSWKV